MRPYDRSSPSAGAAMFAVAAIALGTFYYASYRDALHGFFVLDDYWVMSAASRVGRRGEPLTVDGGRRPGRSGRDQSVFRVAARVKHWLPTVTVNRVLAAGSSAAAAVNHCFAFAFSWNVAGATARRASCWSPTPFALNWKVVPAFPFGGTVPSVRRAIGDVSASSSRMSTGSPA